MSSRDFLERLRPSGTPGAATRAGVPADRVAERTAELEPVLALLADTQAEAARIREQGRKDAAERLRAAGEQARALVAQARRDAQAERGRTAAQARAAATTDAQRRIAAADEQAEQIVRLAAERSPGLVEEVLHLAQEQVREVLEART